MRHQYSEKFVKAAAASGMSPEKFAESIRGLLSPSRCRDTSVAGSAKLFDARVMTVLSNA